MNEAPGRRKPPGVFAFRTRSCIQPKTFASSIPPCSRVQTKSPLFLLSERGAEVIIQAWSEIEAIVHGKDSRKLVIVGPCSIHDPECCHRVRAPALGASPPALRSADDRDARLLREAAYDGGVGRV